MASYRDLVFLYTISKKKHTCIYFAIFYTHVYLSYSGSYIQAVIQAVLFRQFYSGSFIQTVLFRQLFRQFYSGSYSGMSVEAAIKDAPL